MVLTPLLILSMFHFYCLFFFFGRTQQENYSLKVHNNLLKNLCTMLYSCFCPFLREGSRFVRHRGGAFLPLSRGRGGQALVCTEIGPPKIEARDWDFILPS